MVMVGTIGLGAIPPLATFCRFFLGEGLLIRQSDFHLQDDYHMSFLQDTSILHWSPGQEKCFV